MANVNFNRARTPASTRIIAINAPMRVFTQDADSNSSILTDGVAAIRRLVTSEAASEHLDATRNAEYLLADLESLSAGETRICRDSHAVFATGIAATLRLIALQTAEPSPDLDAIADASWLCADLADLIDNELERAGAEDYFARNSEQALQA
jgi:hypothetical protein